MRHRAMLVTCALFLLGCYSEADYNASKTTTRNFHQLMDRGEYEIIYASSDPGFQKNVSREDLGKFLARINRKMGACAEATEIFGGYQTMNVTAYVTVNALRVCKNGNLKEQFVWLMTAGRPTLVKNNADSPLLLSD